jgi:hypothetical protein
MAESRLQRWSRKKTQAVTGAEAAPAPAVEPEQSPEELELVANEALPELEVLEKYNLPNPDAIELGTDITGFMRKEIPELLRRRALRSLWRSNPVLAVLDGLNDYDEDYTTVAGAGKAVQTLYKVGQGFDRTGDFAHKPDEPGDDQTDDRIDSQTEHQTTEAAESAPEALPDEPRETIAEQPAQEVAVEPSFRYRPRMRFDD